MSQSDIDAAIAVTRFGLGARPGEIAAAARDPRAYLKAQIRPDGADLFATGGESSSQRLAEFRAYRRQRSMAGTGAAAEDGARDPVKMARQFIRQNAAGDVLARLQLATDTDAGFRERWALFWANHFTVSATKAQVAGLVGPYEVEAIRPRVFGRFADLLVAAETHPAMLLYLDQAQSVGPNSRAASVQRRGGGRRGAGQPDGRPRRNLGLNENLAREILELHTVGVDGGYAQADVTEFARALTGLSIAGPREAGLEGVVFRPQTHEPGQRTVMDVRYPDDGRAQAMAILADLATKPQTARFVCAKIARHFVADDAPPALVARLEATWRATDGDLARVAETLIEAPEAWSPQAAKFKTPYEFVISSYRALGQGPGNLGQVNAALVALGQRPFGAPSPKGWPDEAAPWAASDALVKRMQFAQAMGAALGPGVQDPTALAREALGARLLPASAAAIGRAESRPEAVALLLMTPEFQRR
ncbi:MULTISPECIES: DUF1800 family protein [unclassified Phenylobacterium]|uniref:DUF1800 domain-containing protein n=1 Tax=unclassified Phenylobacterium TaxID=2640670 RepID=UPI000AD8706E|nr:MULTISPECIES: DUF1800 domain-containing protein [unclassified Phenylobacterium]